MKNLDYSIKKNIGDLKTLISYIDKELNDAPEGRLAWSKRSNGRYCFYQKVDGQKIYIPSDNFNQVKLLSKKEYYQNLKKAVEKELDTLEKFFAKYQPEKKFDVYYNLNEPFKSNVQPIIRDAKMKVAEWKATLHKPYQEHPEALKFYTKGGEYVRSKSEMLIANTLSEYSTELAYIYEPTIVIKNGTANNQLHPDFVIINLRTGEIFYWEHGGLIEFEDYMNSFVWKQRLYESAGIVLGKNLIITLETKKYPLDYKTVVNQIKNILDS